MLYNAPESSPNGGFEVKNIIKEIPNKIKNTCKGIFNKIKGAYIQFRNFFKRFYKFNNSHAPVVRCLLAVVTTALLNFYLITSDFLTEENILTSASKVIMQYSIIIYILLGGLAVCYDTFINRSSARKISFGVLIAYSVVFVEARFILKQDFDKWFWILIVAIIIFSSITTSEDSISDNNEELGVLYSPISNNANLFESRKSQQDTLCDLIQNEKLINDGLSICIKGKWGSGKTSFVNSTLDRLKKEGIKYAEIRINALELEDTGSLIKYYFSRIKEILESNNAYIGLKSEYRSLMNSLLQSATNENLSGFIMNSFEEEEDYRNMISVISNLLYVALHDSRIIIVVDDIERCSDNKIKQLLFFIKEVATMKKCISLFLVDEVKLSQSICNSKDEMDASEFTDKFFDIVISLKAISIKENIERFDNPTFKKLIKGLFEFYNQQTKKINDDRYIRYSDMNERKKTKEDDLERVDNKIKAMTSLLVNPRRMIKIYNCYYQYCLLIDRIIKEVDSEKIGNEEVKKFLCNIEFEKQLLIISILKDSFYDQFCQISNGDIDDIIRLLPQECWLRDIIIKEWSPLVTNYFTKYKVSFSDALIKGNYKAIVTIITPFSDKYEEYKSSILQGRLPISGSTEISLSDCFEVLHSQIVLDSNLIKKMFEIYMPKISFDEALTIFYSNSVAYGRDIAISEFADTFCTSDCLINDIESCKESFNRIYPKMLWKFLLNYKAYYCHHELHMDEGIEESVFNNQSLEDSINVYINKVCNKFNFTLRKTTVIEKLKEMLDLVKKHYRQKGYPVNASDFKNLLKHSLKAVVRIEALSRIEHFIYSQNSSSGSEKDSLLDEINNIREIIKKQSESGDIVLKYERFDEFLKRAEQHGLSFDEYNAFEKMTEELSTIDLSYSVQARRLLLRLEQHQNNADES